MIALRTHITATPTGNGMVLLDTRSGKYWQLNATGTLILSDLLAGASMTEAATRLTLRHPAAARRADDDVHALLQQLRAAHLLIQDRP
ncbi:lasso peptide biosynthesis PqqD family chaperone [Nonomuraea sp. NPDC003560]|uniref:lasso peptide biosynthesis PqqD family chaperone n=1 Tax=Nonomuraea sp. NPDC003560 TaxID=3364341 RepID=UPI00369FF421